MVFSTKTLALAAAWCVGGTVAARMKNKTSHGDQSQLSDGALELYLKNKTMDLNDVSEVQSDFENSVYLLEERKRKAKMLEQQTKVENPQQSRNKNQTNLETCDLSVIKTPEKHTRVNPKKRAAKLEWAKAIGPFRKGIQETLPEGGRRDQLLSTIDKMQPLYLAGPIDKSPLKEIAKVLTETVWDHVIGPIRKDVQETLPEGDWWGEQFLGTIDHLESLYLEQQSHSSPVIREIAEALAEMFWDHVTGPTRKEIQALPKGDRNRDQVLRIFDHWKSLYLGDRPTCSLSLKDALKHMNKALTDRARKMSATSYKK